MSDPNESAFEIHPPGKILKERDGAIYEAKSTPWIKMSVSFRQFLSKLSGAQLKVFLCLALHINEDNQSWPKLDTIMNETHLARQTVVDAIEALENMDWISVKRKHRQVNRYMLKGLVSYGEDDPHIWVYSLDSNLDVGSSDKTQEGELESSLQGSWVKPTRLQVEPLSKANKKTKKRGRTHKMRPKNPTYGKAGDGYWNE